MKAIAIETYDSSRKEGLVHPVKTEQQRATRKFISISLRCEKGLVTSQPARILQNKLTTTTTSPETLLSSFSVGHLLLGMGLSLKSGFVHSETPWRKPTFPLGAVTRDSVWNQTRSSARTANALNN